MKKLLPALLGTFLLLACTGPIEEKEGELGKEVSPSDMQKAVKSVLAGISIGNAQKKQYVEYYDNRKIESNDPYGRRFIRHELEDIKFDNPSDPKNSKTVTFVVNEDLVTFDPNGVKNPDGSDKVIDHKNSEVDLTFSLTQPSAVTQTGFFKISSNDNLCDGIDETDPYGNPYDCLKYYNLKTERRTVNPPEAVKAKPNCMGLPQCKMVVEHLQYDVVEWKAGHSVGKYQISADIAPDVADLLYENNADGSQDYMYPVLSRCVRQKVLIGGTYYNVSDCSWLTDFGI
jgi:hypothetical protein